MDLIGSFKIKTVNFEDKFLKIRVLKVEQNENQWLRSGFYCTSGYEYNLMVNKDFIYNYYVREMLRS